MYIFRIVFIFITGHLFIFHLSFTCFINLLSIFEINNIHFPEELNSFLTYELRLGSGNLY